MATSKLSLDRARKEKNDEFYTLLEDIDLELSHYESHFKDKIIYCNCDNPFKSNFVQYFIYKAIDLGINRLICTCYDKSDDEVNRQAYCLDVPLKDIILDYDLITTKDEIFTDFIKAHTKKLNGNGDFRSDECINILKQADIVITNPPFSLFREYIAQLIEFDKKFLIIGNVNALGYRDIFPFIKKNKVWLGITKPKVFVKPDGTTQKFGNITWFTNLDYPQRHNVFVATHKYNPNEYPKYDNYDAIEVCQVKRIPYDYVPQVIEVETKEELDEITRKLDKEHKFYTVEKVE